MSKITVVVSIREDVILVSFPAGPVEKKVAMQVKRQLEEKHNKPIKFLPKVPHPFSIIEIEG